MTHLTHTLNGSAQQISLLGCVGALLVQADGANANPVYIGGATVSSSDYGVRIPAAVGGEPSAPFMVNWEHYHKAYPDTDIVLYVLGTNAQKLHFIYQVVGE